MSMTQPTPSSRPRRPSSFWATPAVSVAIGVAMGGSAWIGGDPFFAAFAFALMLATAIGLIVTSRHSETVKGVLDGRDERISAIDRTASLMAGLAVIWAIGAGVAWELATGGDVLPYVWLGTVGGLTYLVTLIVLRIRG